MTMPYDDNTLQRLVTFFQRYYQEDIADLANHYPQERTTLRVDHANLRSFDADIANSLIEHPEDRLSHMAEALDMVDIPIDIDLGGAGVRIHNLLETHIYGVGELRAKHAGQFIGVQGHISRVTPVKPKIETAVFQCVRCENRMEVPQPSGEFVEPHECPGCDRQAKTNLLIEESEFVNRRKIQLKQPPEAAENGEGDTMPVFLEGEQADPPGISLETRVGEDAIIYGYVELDQEGNQRSKSPVFAPYLVGNSFEFERDTDEIDVQEHKEDFTAAANSPNAYEKFIQSMGRGIYPYGRWPLALRLGAAFLMGGVRVDPTEGATYRGDIHMAIVGPPGVGKSQFSQNLAELSPGSEHRSATGLSSDVGLTAAAVQDDFADGDGWVLKPGILPRADDHVILDEADKTGADLNKMNDALEGEQMASIDKGGINAKLKTRVGLCGLANPDDGRWDETQPIKQQIDIDETLWSRFDGIVLLEDTPDEEQDSELAEYVLENYDTNLQREKSDTTAPETEEGPVSWDALRAWVKYARKNYRPELTDDAKDLIEDYYVEIRNDGSFSENSHPTPRKLETGIRFATAFARIRLSETVERCDAKLAIDLSKEILGQSLNGGELDANVFTEAEEATQRKRKDRIRDAIQGEHKTPEDIADETGVPLEKVQEDLEHWRRRTNPSPVTKNQDGYRWIA